VELDEDEDRTAEEQEDEGYEGPEDEEELDEEDEGPEDEEALDEEDVDEEDDFDEGPEDEGDDGPDAEGDEGPDAEEDLDDDVDGDEYEDSGSQDDEEAVLRHARTRLDPAARPPEPLRRDSGESRRRGGAPVDFGSKRDRKSNQKEATG
jgi:hypothetical protein